MIYLIRIKVKGMKVHGEICEYVLMKCLWMNGLIAIDFVRESWTLVRDKRLSNGYYAPRWSYSSMGWHCLFERRRSSWDEFAETDSIRIDWSDRVVWSGYQTRMEWIWRIPSHCMSMKWKLAFECNNLADIILGLTSVSWRGWNDDLVVSYVVLVPIWWHDVGSDGDHCCCQQLLKNWEPFVVLVCLGVALGSTHRDASESRWLVIAMVAGCSSPASPVVGGR